MYRKPLPPPPVSPVSYTYTKVTDLEKTTMVGNHQCIALVRHYAGAPATLAWKQGEAVLGNRLLRKGTAIATFINGKYANHQQGNHAALYLRQTLDGITVMDQWSGKRLGIVTSCTLRSKGQYKNGLYIDSSNNADAFFVIE